MVFENLGFLKISGFVWNCICCSLETFSFYHELGFSEILGVGLLIGVDLVSICSVFYMYFCNLNARFTPIFLKITLITHFLMFCRNRK